ncbi:hypothetical protein [Mesorhizobium onobrychidis]|uniref:hypothetical protein n=1 Tax=Mesorhizobium onobrychidis TaxID=2775404 RepID=UPI0035A86022
MFFERQLYTSFEKDLSKNVDLELAFAHLEGIVAPLIARIVETAKHNRGVALHSNERQLLATYTYYQWKGVPDNFRIQPCNVPDRWREGTSRVRNPIPPARPASKAAQAGRGGPKRPSGVCPFAPPYDLGRGRSGPAIHAVAFRAQARGHKLEAFIFGLDF